MNSREKALTERLLFGLAAACLTCGTIGMVAFLNTDASYPVPTEPNDTAQMGAVDEPLEVSPMPEDAYTPVRLTFAGSCTVGSMLGSDSYGTFNEKLNAEGAEYFLSHLREQLNADRLTVAGCDAVLSDNDELAAADRGVLAWYRGSSRAADIFRTGGVDLLSLHCYHTWDYGAEGYEDTKNALESAGLLWGDHGRAQYVEQDGITVAVYCRYVDDETDAEAVRLWLETASVHDFVALYITTPIADDYLPDESRQTMFRSFVDAGANLVVGTDTEKLQPRETWGDGEIFYSLGALLDGTTKYPEPYTALLEAELRVLDGELQDVEYTVTPCRTYAEDHPWQPYELPEDGDEAKAVAEFLNGLRETPELGE